jgi:hypothetical protein
MIYGSSTFHVITFLEVRDGDDVVGAVRGLRDAIGGVGPGEREGQDGRGKLVYAGQAAFTRSSDQIGERSWNAVVLVQYPSRADYEAAAGDAAYQRALAGFARSYAHGMKRPWLPNLLMPQVLLGLRVVDIVQGNWHVAPLEPVPGAQGEPQLQAVVSSLTQLRAVNEDAVLIFNLIKPGSADQQKENSSYGRSMVKRMASLAHGPMHVGRSVTLEGDATFEEVIIVYYPGPAYFAELLQSRFFQGIIGGKQLGDTQVVPTVPILSLL